MERSDGILKQIIARRVPQIIGLYIAATWMTVEIGEWVTEQLGLSSGLVFYVFVLMVALLPAVAVLAWNHGAPGRDQSPRGEKLFVSANATVALALLLIVGYFGPVSSVSDAQAATMEKVVVDEAGQEQVFQVAREGFNQRVMLSFWTNDTPSADSNSAWERYAIPWLISVELNFDPLLSAQTAYLYGDIETLTEAGFADATGEPLALALDIAQDTRADFLIRGHYESSDSGYRLTAKIYNAQTGQQIDELQSANPDLITAVAELNQLISPALTAELTRGGTPFTSIQLAEAATASSQALEALTQGLNRWLFGNDYSGGIEDLNRALEIDPEFALAHFWLHALHRLNGDFASSTQASEAALAFDYKLHSETNFVLKANSYATRGEFERAVRVIDMWTQVHPESERAWIALAQNYLFLSELDKARTALESAREIDADNPGIFRMMARLEELSGNIDLAIQTLRDYLSNHPQDADSWLSLANMQMRSGQIEAAADAYENASIIDSNNFTAELGLIRTEIFNGELERAQAMLKRAITNRAPGSDLAQLLTDHALLFVQMGQPKAGLEFLTDHEEVLQQSLPPILYISTISQLEAALFALSGDHAAALATVDEVMQSISAPMNQFFLPGRVQPLIELNRLDEARQTLDQIRIIMQEFDFPGQDISLLQAEARLLAFEGKYDEALENVTTAYEQISTSGLNMDYTLVHHLLHQRVEYALAGNQLNVAQAASDHLLRVNPNHGEGLWQRVQIEYALGNIDEARNRLQALLEQWKNAEADYPLYQQSLTLAESLGAQG